MRLAVHPFALASEETVRFQTPWHDIRRGQFELLGDRIDDWDYLTVLTLRADLEVDVREARDSAHLGENTGLAVCVSAGSSSTRMRGPVWRADVASLSRDRLAIEVELSGSELGGRLDLITQLVIRHPDPRDELGPRSRGAIIWTHRHSVMLEGAGAQFPTEAADLSQHWPKSAWLLEIDSDDLDVVAAGVVRLTVNESHPVMRGVLDGNTTPEAVQALDALRWDVTRRLVNTGLESSEFIERDGAFEEDSLGWLLTNVLATHFPGQTAAALRALQTTDPARFEAMLQDAARILG